MPAIEKLIASRFENVFHPDDQSVPALHTPIANPVKRNPFLRCPMPPLAPISVDNLDKYDMHGLIPQYRVLR